MKKILFVVGSLRKDSFNRKMAAEAEKMLAGCAEISYLDYSNLPYMNQDIEFPAPETVAKVRATVQNVDGLWFFTPEYNYSYPGVLKNLLDWLSRPLKANDFASGTAVLGKKASISGIGGKFKTEGSRAKLKELLEFVKMEVLPESTGASANAEAWAGGELILSDETKTELRKQADAFLNFLQ